MLNHFYKTDEHSELKKVVQADCIRETYGYER